MLNIKGETRVDYFHVLCETCGGRVTMERLRMAGGVPELTFTCDTCKQTDTLKLDSVAWAKIPIE